MSYSFSVIKHIFKSLTMLLFLGLFIFYLSILYFHFFSRAKTSCAAVLTGSEPRIETSLALVKQGHFKKIFISGVGCSRPPRQRSLVALSKNNPGVELGFQATNTPENIQEISQWARTKNITTLALLTCDYHMPRTLWLAKRYAPHLACLPYAVPSSWSRLAVRGVKEYVKFILTLLGKSSRYPAAC